MIAPITPVPTGEPVSTVVIAVIAGIGALFRLFGGGVSGAVKSALEGMRGVIQQVSDNLLRFAWYIGIGLGKVLSALHTIWVRVIWPLIRNIPRLVDRVRRLIERDLPRLLKLIDRIRQRVLELYERYTRPILEHIQRIRKMLLILRLFRIKWAEQLDARLSQVQERLMYPVRVLLEHIALVEQWINVIITADQLIQDVIWNNTVFHHQDPLARSVLSAFSPPLDPLTKLELWPRNTAVTAEQTRAHMDQYLKYGTGPIADDVRKAADAIRRGV